MDNIYIDCNILIDWLAERHPFALSAEILITKIENKKVEGYVSPLTLSNTYYLLSHHFNKKVAFSFLKDCISIFKILPITRKNAINAIENYYKDFEDDLHYQVAIENGITVIITRNKNDFPKGNIHIMNSEEYLDYADL